MPGGDVDWRGSGGERGLHVHGVDRGLRRRPARATCSSLNGPRTCSAMFTPAGSTTGVPSDDRAGARGRTGERTRPGLRRRRDGVPGGVWGGDGSDSDGGAGRRLHLHQLGRRVQRDRARRRAMRGGRGAHVFGDVHGDGRRAGSGPAVHADGHAADGRKIQAAGINCGAGGTACSVTMPAAMSIGVEAAASAGYTFTAWTGDCVGTSAGLACSR